MKGDDGKPTVVLKDENLKALRAAFKKVPHIKVGVIAGRSGKGASNAMIAAAHEFGTSTMPKRSIFRTPVKDHLNAYLAKAGAFDKETIRRVIRERSIAAWMEKVLAIVLRIVDDGFESGGFGKWKALKKYVWRRKKTKQILVETGQLRRSITGEVRW